MNEQEPLGVFSIRNYFNNEGEEKTHFLKCGVAFPRKSNKKGFILKLHSYSLKGDYLICPEKK